MSFESEWSELDHFLAMWSWVNFTLSIWVSSISWQYLIPISWQYLPDNTVERIRWGNLCAAMSL